MNLSFNVQEIDGRYNVVIAGGNRTSYTPCNSKGHAVALMHIASSNIEVAEKLHGLKDE